MGYTLAVFRARTQTLLFVSLLKSYNIPVFIIDTPRELNISCGISAKFDSIFKDTAECLIARRQFNSFAGFFDF